MFKRFFTVDENKFSDDFAFTINTPNHLTAMLAARGYALDCYSSLEIEMTEALTTLTEMDDYISNIIFWRIVNSKSRLTILDECLNYRTTQTPALSVLCPFWNSVLSRIRALDQSRNNIIHWTHAAKHLGPDIVPQPVIIKPGYRKQTSQEYSVNDVLAFSDNCYSARRGLGYFLHAYQHIRQGLQIEPQSSLGICLSPIPDQPQSNHPLFRTPSRWRYQHQPSPK